MSVRLMAAVFELDVSPQEKLVLLAMADHARDDGTGCYPSVQRLALKTSLSERGVQKIIRRLERNGLLLVSKSSRGRFANEYSITIAPLFHNPAPGAPLRGVLQPRTPVHPTPHASASNPAPGSPQPLMNHHEPKTRVQPRDARNRIDDEIEQRRRIAARDTRLGKEAELRKELGVGAGPELFPK